MKNLLKSVLVTISMAFIFTTTPSYANGDINVYLNGEKLLFDVAPVNIDGRILVPFRAILEKLGAEVSYEKGFARGKTLGKDLLIPIGENFININSCSLAVDVPAQIIDGRTLVPIRVVSECMGACVEWDSTTSTVTITAPKESSIHWNETHIYYGDIMIVDNYSVANGYGCLYNTEDNTISCKGLFENNTLLKGLLNYSDGSFYIGEFSSSQFGVRDGKGSFCSKDGNSILESFWSNDISNGKFSMYLRDENTKVSGVAVNGNWHGNVTFYNLTSGTTSTLFYENGEIVSGNNTASYSSYDISTAFAVAEYPLYLYSNDGRTFLGKLTTDKYDSESISNPYGNYGSKYSDTSIFYKYGDYGSNYGEESVFYKYASEPPIIVDSNGKFIAYLTANEYNDDGVTYLELMSILKKYRQ